MLLQLADNLLFHARRFAHWFKSRGRLGVI